MFGTAFRPDRKSVEYPQPKSKAQGLVLTITHVSLTKYLHSDHGFAGGFHLFQHGNNGGWIGVHVRADRIDASEIHFNPGRICSRAQRLN